MLTCARCAAVAFVVLLNLPAAAFGEARISSVIRLKGDRLEEVYDYATLRSPSFRELITTLESLQRTVYVEEGGCAHAYGASCLLPLLPTSTKILVVHLNPRLPLLQAVAQLAHELYHALEVSREPTVTDAASMRQLFARIGENSCRSAGEECWETRAAQAFEQLVRRELLGREPL